jgi:hypothetical protein
MELLLFAGTLVALGLAAYFFGYDSRDPSAFVHQGRAVDARLDSRLSWSSGSP